MNPLGVASLGVGGAVGSVAGSAVGAAVGWTHPLWIGLGAGLWPRAISAGIGVLVGGAVAPIAALGVLAVWGLLDPSHKGRLPNAREGRALGDGLNQSSVNPHEFYGGVV